MRKIYITFLTLTLLLLSGCTVYVDQDIDINADHSGSIVYTTYLEEDMYDSMMEQFGDAESDFEEREGFTVTEYNQDGMKGLTIETDFSNLDELKTLLFEDDIILTYTENSDGSMDVEITYPSTVGDDGEQIGTVNYDVLIKVPKVVKHNAEDKTRNTLNWTFDSDEENVLTFTYKEQPIIEKVLIVLGYTALGAGVLVGGYFGYNKFKQIAIKQGE